MALNFATLAFGVGELSMLTNASRLFRLRQAIGLLEVAKFPVDLAFADDDICNSMENLADNEEFCETWRQISIIADIVLLSGNLVTSSPHLANKLESAWSNLKAKNPNLRSTIGSSKFDAVEGMVGVGVIKGADNFLEYVKNLKTKVNPRKDYPDGIFERKVTGDDIQYEAIGGGEKIWADGVDAGKKALVDAKHNPGDFYTFDSYTKKPFLYEDLVDEFERYSVIIADKSNPVDELIIVISKKNENTVNLFQHLGEKYKVPVKIELIEWTP